MGSNDPGGTQQNGSADVIVNHVPSSTASNPHTMNNDITTSTAYGGASFNQPQMMNGPHGIPQRGVSTIGNFQGPYSQANTSIVGNKLINTISSSLGNNQANAAGQQLGHPGGMNQGGINQGGIRVS